MDFINENVIKCLKQEIDAYRDKYAITLQEIKELNVIKYQKMIF